MNLEDLIILIVTCILVIGIFVLVFYLIIDEHKKNCITLQEIDQGLVLIMNKLIEVKDEI